MSGRRIVFRFNVNAVLFPLRVVRGNKIIRYFSIIIGILGGAASGYMLTQKKVVRKMVEPGENKVNNISQAITEMEGQKDNALAFAGNRY